MADSGGNGGMLAEVKAGLGREQKELPPKYFYDRAGSELFEEITRLPEYYLTRAEVRILRGPVRDWLREARPRSLVELGAGSARKTRIILDGLAGERTSYVPVDVSAEFLQETASELRAEYLGLRVRPLVADLSDPGFPRGNGTDPFGLEPEDRPVLVAFLGSTIGNFAPRAAVALLLRVRERMAPDDAFLLGVDLRPGAGKSLERLEAAYDDARGVTARFNRNVLHVLNRELGTDFEPSAFRHRAFYDPVHHRIEMHLEAARSQAVRLPDGTEIRFRERETVRTEVSHKYDRASVEEMLRGAGMVMDAWLADDEGLYAMAVGRPLGTPGSP